jgi:MFS family permease
MAQEKAFQPYDRLNNPTFHGLLIAEFLAAFLDQCIHAAAMFFAIHKQILNEGTAISLMPLLFYVPWALFASLSGYAADRFSKRSNLVFWKFTEIGISSLALLGFWLGSDAGPDAALADTLGPVLVMACVFLMGTHSAFFVPNKYGVLPEIFTVRILSRANGLIESTTFLAVILGTAIGGLLSSAFRGQEYYIGLILLGLALFGTITALFIRRMPPAAPDRPFPGWAPWEHYKPVLKNLGVLLRSRLASVAILGLAFFAFMVAFMRATMYMFGESQNPRWDEWHTSIIVAVVSFGVGLGSPLAGYLSGGKVELGLIPVGVIGIVTALVMASFSIFSETALVVCLIFVGLFSGFYLVPLYSLLQYSAPKGSKGQSVATNNFMCTVGPILASVVFFSINWVTVQTGVAERMEVQDVAAGKLLPLKGERHHPERMEVETGPRRVYTVEPKPIEPGEGEEGDEDTISLPTLTAAKAARNLVKLDDDVQVGDEVKVSWYQLRDINYYLVRKAHKPLPDVYNREQVPRYLFLSAAVLMALILLALCRRLPDLMLRSVIWLRTLGKPFIKVHGPERLPTGRAILATNCKGLAENLHVVAGIVRPVRFLIREQTPGERALPMARYLARQAGVVFFREGDDPDVLADQGLDSLRRGENVAVGADDPEVLRRLLAGAQGVEAARVVPVYCRLPLTADRNGVPGPGAQLFIGEPLPPMSTVEDVYEALRKLEAP